MSNPNDTTNKSLVEIHKEKVFATALIVAEQFNKRHDSIIRKIERRFSSKEPEILEFNLHNFEEMFYKDSYGREQKTYRMTEDGFTELAMSFTGDKAMLIRIRFLKAFRKAIDEITRLKEQRLAIDWNEARKKGKEVRNKLGSAIQLYEQHADKQGGWVKNKKTGEPTKPENRHYYPLISSEIYAQLFADRKLKEIRDTLDALQIQFLTICEGALTEEIKAHIDIGTEYHEIYYACKRRLTEVVNALSLTRVKSYGVNNIKLSWETKEPHPVYQVQHLESAQ